MNQELEHRTNTALHTPEPESISVTFDSNPQQLVTELQPFILSPPPWLCMMDYHLWQPQRVLERREDGWGRSVTTGTYSSEGSARLRNYGMTEIWGG